MSQTLDFIRRLLHLRSDQEPPTLGAQPARQQALFERLRSAYGGATKTEEVYRKWCWQEAPNHAKPSSLVDRFIFVIQMEICLLLTEITRADRMTCTYFDLYTSTAR